jgi:protein-tyrosine kinase
MLNKIPFRTDRFGQSQPAEADDDKPALLQDRSIGDLMRETCGLTDQQLEQIAEYQRLHGVRFGEAAVSLNLVNGDDVLRALSLQFHYAYAPELSQGKKDSELVAAANPFSDQAETFRDLRSQLLMGVLGVDQPRRALAIVSPNVGDGKTYIAANLAVAFSQLGGRTLLVDADMRTPRQHKLFEIDHAFGLSTVLSGRTERSVVQQVKDLPSLYVMPVGGVPPNPLELLQGPAFGRLIHELLQKFDHVLVDAPAAVHGADARVIAARSGAALVVGRKGRSRMEEMQGLLAKLGKSPMAIAGVIMNEA